MLGLRETEFPRPASMLERGEGAGTGTAVVARDEHDVSLGFRHASSNRAHARLSNELDVDASYRIGVLQVVDQLLEILD